MIDLLRPRFDEARSMACALGMLKLPPGKPPQPLGFALTPAPIPPETLEQLTSFTINFNRLIHATAQDHLFLQDALEPAAAKDSFLARLLSLLPACNAKSRKIYLNRYDFFLASHIANTSLTNTQSPSKLPVHTNALTLLPQLVEMNTCSVSYTALASRIQQLQAILLHGTPWSTRLPNNPCLEKLAGFLATAFQHCDGHDACFLMVVQPDEANLADQHLLEHALIQHGVPVLRQTLSQIAQQGRLKDGHLWINQTRAAVACLRSGYRPEDLAQQDDWRGREMLTQASVVEIPDIAGQLAGMKKIQQLLCQPSLLKRFALSAHHDLLPIFTPMYALDDSLPDGTPALAKAMESPHEYVLKPQREGGGNNLFDQALSQKLRTLSPQEKPAWTLMQRLQPVTHQTLLANPSSNQPSQVEVVSEVSRIGFMLTESKQEIINQDSGFLVRTKPCHFHEGGIAAGFGALDSLLYEDDYTKKA